MPDSTKNDSPLKTLQEAAHYLRIEERAMRSLRQRAAIPVVRVSPGRIAFRIKDLDEYIADHVEQPRRRRNGRRS